MSKTLKIVGIVIGILVIGCVGLVEYSKSVQADALQVVLSKLDYTAMDAKGFSHQAMETSAKGCLSACLGKGQNPSICENGCACSINKTVALFSKEEFAELDTALGMKLEPKPELKEKMIKAVTECRNQ